jgi:hypothetical protein
VGYPYPCTSLGAVRQSHDVSDTNEKMGLKIRILVPNQPFILSLRLASSCRVSDAEEQAAEMDTGAAAAHTGDDDDGRARSQSGMTQDQEQDHQNHLNPLPV